MYTPDHSRAKHKLRYWNEILQEWIFMVNRVYRISKKHSGVHAEKERANTGLLAAAAVRNGWVALEESKTEKEDKNDSKSSYVGSCDLILWRDQRHHEIEAKFMRHVLFSSNRDKIIKTYNKAIADSLRSKYTGLRSEKKIAITYIVPIIAPSKLQAYTEDEIGKELQLLIKDIKQEFSPDLIAYTFPGEIDMVKKGNHKALGVIMIGNLS